MVAVSPWFCGDGLAFVFVIFIWRLNTESMENYIGYEARGGIFYPLIKWCFDRKEVTYWVVIIPTVIYLIINYCLNGQNMIENFVTLPDRIASALNMR